MSIPLAAPVNYMVSRIFHIDYLSGFHASIEVGKSVTYFLLARAKHFLGPIKCELSGCQGERWREIYIEREGEREMERDRERENMLFQ